jgi:hypothetical protein
MKKPSIFISSTCNDLAQIRDDLKRFVEDGLGYEALLSEQNFPLNPNLDTVNNCLNVVQEHADIFVLIIGNRYGYIPVDKSITNLEYIHAKAKGIPIYVFIKKEILSYLKIWRQNPSANFENMIDSTRLFEFIDTIMNEDKQWIKEFECAQGIISDLKEQLAYLYLKCLKSYSGLGSIQTLKNVPLQIAIEKPRVWEFKLFAEVLAQLWAKAEDLRHDYKYRIVYGKMTEISEPIKVIEWAMIKSSELMRYVDNITKLVREVYIEALGKPGEDGDVDYINYTANRLVDIYKCLIKWTLDHEMLIVPDELSNYVMANSQLSSTLIEDLESFFVQIIQGKESVDCLPDNSEVDFTLTIRPPDIENYTENLNTVRQLYRLNPTDIC